LDFFSLTTSFVTFVITAFLFMWNNRSFIRWKSAVLANGSVRTPHVPGPECGTGSCASCWLWLLGGYWSGSSGTSTSNV